MRLLIAGWQGQIARAFVEIAPGRADITACALGRPALDICEVRSIERALSDDKPDVVINTAGYTAVDEAEAEPERALAMNRDGARLLALSAARRGVPVIHLSTVNVFDGSKSAPYVEDDVAHPLNVYGHSKLAGEALVREANPRHVIVRTSWVFSPFGRNFVTTILAAAREGKPLRVVSDQFGNPSYAPDLAMAIIDVAARAHAAGIAGDDSLWGTYHLANGGGPASWRDLAQEVCRAAKLDDAADAITPIATAEHTSPTRRPRNAALDTTRLQSSFAIRLRDWREAVAMCVARLARRAPR